MAGFGSMTDPVLSTGALVVFALIAVTLVLFVTEAIPTDVTAIGVLVSLAVLEPLTGVSAGDAISGFASTATITIVAMYMLSAGIQQTGLVQRLGLSLARFARGSETRALAATIVTTGPLAGFVNNTPIVAVFIPMISELAQKTRMSPSKLLLPLSYAAILGGTLTLIGTSTNLLASEFAVELVGRDPIGLFEFSALGVVILVVGLAYLMTVGRWLTPGRAPIEGDLVDEFDLQDHLTQVRVRPDASAIGSTVGELESRSEAKIRILQLRREDGPELTYDEAVSSGTAASEPPTEHPLTAADATGDTHTTDRPGHAGAIAEHSDSPPASAGSGADDAVSFASVSPDTRIEADDVLTVHGTLQAVNRFVGNQGLSQLVRRSVTEETFEAAASDDVLAKAVVPPESSFAGERLADSHLREVYRTTVLAIRRDGELLRTGLGEQRLQPGDLLLVQTVPETVDYFGDGADLVVVDEDVLDRLLEDDSTERASLSPKTPVAVAIMAGVIGAAALGLVPIVISALAGVFCMVVTGCLSTSDAYDAVSWNVVFLLAGVLPLGIALEATGGSAVIAGALGGTASYLPHAGILFLCYLATGVLANVITPVATIVLMAPIAVDTATSLGAAPYPFLLAVTFAAATSFSTPVGYQTNLMVYGPGQYEFTDFLRVGGPLQLLLSVVTSIGIVAIWGV
ncbi:citrate/succinate, 2-oxoglutarate/malate transporter [Halovivax asiaticus JCM 14624]|uniref:Citrate/succinate, 2-oxoglutarate/malate transporter n=1 Tax=Halovivax asiaticus JCM 14624 TaxID=1227490 RepID=M0BNZ7_9EURY|nr:SLC13 family permease [Halovivax asiaticus]ELZ12611.1 citrate/succinate, 2-oxoglutarate/malate transporter [Halovivax asiaticus JCM 14624]